MSNFLERTLAATGMVVHLISYLSDLGVPRDNALQITSLIGIGLNVARVIAGWLLDWFDAKLVAAVARV